jgi:hypothetical protein
MAFSSNTLELPEELRTLVLSENCVAFIGSGLSVGCYHAWPELVNALCARCGCTSRVAESSTGDAFLDAAQDAKNANEQVYYEFLGEHFGRPAEYASLLYDALLSLPFFCYLTVNLDPLLALKCRTAKIACDTNVMAYPSLDRKAMTRRSIHYMHGYIHEGSTPSPGTIVLARGEFEEAYEANSNLMTFLIPTLVNEPILFVGCRLQEPTMPRVFRICKQQQERRLRLTMECGQRSEVPPRKFILLPEVQIENAQGQIDTEESRAATEKEDRYYQELDVKPVRYTVSGSDHTALRLAFERLGGLAEISPTHGWKGNTYAT